MPASKEKLITFKVDSALAGQLQRLPNRSEFIRSAILSALDATCPLCGGTGKLSLDQKRHWEQFTEDHALAECDECHEVHLVCEHHDEP